MSEEVAKLKATIEIDSKSAQNSVNIINQRIDSLNKKMQEGEKLTAKENAELKRLVKTLADLGNSANKTQIAEEKMRATREKSSNELKNKSIINEQKLATEREKTRKATIQAEQSELRLNKQKDSLNKTTNNSNGLWSTLATRFTVAGLAANTITGLFNNLKNSIQQTGNEALDFQDKMAMVNTILQQPKESIDKLGTSINDMAINLKSDPKDLASGMYDVVSSVDETVDKLEVLEKSTKAAKAGYTDVGTAVKAGVQVANAYGMSMNDLSKIYDIQFKTLDKGILNYGEYSQALGNVIASATKAKVPFEEMSGQLVALTKNGLDASEATTALGRFYDSVYEKSDIFKKIGINVSDSNGKLRSTTDILEELGKVLSNYSEIDQVNILEKLGFEVRAGKTVQLIGQNIDKTRQYIDEMYNSAGQMETAYTKAIDTIASTQMEGSAKLQKASDEFRQHNEKNIIELMKSWTDFKVWIINLFDRISQIVGKTSSFASTGKEFNDIKKNNQKFLKANEDYFKKRKQQYEKSQEDEQKGTIAYNKKSIELYENSLQYKSDVVALYNDKNKKQEEDNVENFKDSLSKSSTGFKDWAGDLKGYFQNVMNNSSTMAVEVAKNMLATITAFQTYSKYMPKAKAKGLLSKDARLQGYSEDWITENIDKPLESLYSNPETIEILKKVIAGGGKLKSLEDVPSGGGSNGSTGSSSDKDNELNIDKLKANIEEEVRIAKEMAKLFNTSQVDLAKELEGIYKKGSETATQYKWEEAATKFSNLAKEQTTIITKDEEEKKYLEFKREYIDQQEEIFKEEKEFRTRLEALGEPVTRGNIDNLIGIWEEQIINLTKLDEGVGNFTNAIEYLKNKVKTAKATLETEDLWKEFLDTTEEITNEIIDNINEDYSSYNGDNASYNTSEMEDEFTVAFRGKNSVESMNSTYDTLFEKYKGNTEALELLTDIYNNQTGNIETFSDKLSASASFVSELSSVLDNEFLSSLANAMNGISSMSSVIGNAGGIANLGFGGWASIATSAISIASSIGLFGGNDAEEQQRQAEINQNFQDAVNTFAQAVEDFSSKEKIDLANVLEGFGGINVSEVGEYTTLAYQRILENGEYTMNNTYIPYAYSGQISSELEEYISDNFGLTLDVDPILARYRYDIEETMGYINSLIEDSYSINLDAYKEQVGLTSDSFVSAIKEGMENATALDISSMIESAFYDSYSAMIGEVFGESIGDTISETMFDVLENAGVTQSDLANMSVSDQIAYIQSLMDNSSTYLSELFDELGLSVSDVKEEFDSLSNQDLPSLVKIGAYEALASNNYTSSTTINIGSAYGTVDRTFVNLTNTAVNSTTNKRTMN